ncbi:MAG: hypothetical protein HFI72_05830 [Peptococcaceae bacterium]|jgi:hypothetical protein|nr:hypothetical protein [Peptococcaceae bacterium]
MDTNAMETTNSTFVIAKTNGEKRQVFGWANVAVRSNGEVICDWQEDMVDMAELEQAAYEFVLHSRQGGEKHCRAGVAVMIESMVFTKEKMLGLGLPAGIIPEGWWIGFQILDDAVWQKIKQGEYTMFSIEGEATREAIK